MGPYVAYGDGHPPYWAPGVPGQYYYLGSTSMTTPHVSGVLALMLQKDMQDGTISLTQEQAEHILESTAYPITWDSTWVINPFTGHYELMTLGVNATDSGLVQANAAVNAVSDKKHFLFNFSIFVG